MNASGHTNLATLTVCLKLGVDAMHPAVPAPLDLTAEADLLDVAARHGCRFEGPMEAFTATGTLLQFTDYRPGSPAYGGTLAVRWDATSADLRREIFSQREAFAAAPDAGFFAAADRA